MRRFVVFGLLSLTAVCNFAQKPVSLQDTVLIGEVVSYGDLRKFQSGEKLATFSAGELKIGQEGGLDQLLSRFTTVYVKTDAGGLSTIHFRGTSADHTSVNFGGININSMTLGHSNLSGIGTYLFDNIVLQYGSSSAVNGSGAIGGALYLGLDENWTDGMDLRLNATTGSFGEFTGGAKIFAGNGRWESVTRFVHFSKENNFPFRNPYTGNVENPGAVRDIQKGAALRSFGFIQELNYRFDKYQFMKTSAWYENFWYQVQPNMPSNYHFNGTEEIANSSLRVWSEYNNSKHFVKFRGGLGYVHDMQIYDKNENQHIGSDRLIAEIAGSADFSGGLGLKIGSKYRYIVPNVYTYPDSVIQFEHQLEIFLSAYYRLAKNLRFTLNLRQMLVSGYAPPFTPSLGGAYVLRTGTDSYLKITTALAKSYRVPTFNDRYWGTQGNPDLKPESGNSAELGTLLGFNPGNSFYSIGLNAFYMKVKNWIEWRNFGVWMAQNIMEVASRGIELQLKSDVPVGAARAQFTVNYTLNAVEPLKTADENGLVGRQMNYMPKHMGNAVGSIGWKQWQFFVDGNYTGKRYWDDFGHTLDGYFLWNTSLERRMELKKHDIVLLFSVNNVFNKGYQNQKYYAMPGRSFRLSLKYDLNLINNP